MHPVLSVVISTHNRSAEAAETVGALLPQRRGRPVEVVLVDSASAPEHAPALAALAARTGVVFARLETPGLSKARNAAVALSRGTWLGFLDDDACPRHDWLEAALRRIEASGPRVGLIAGRVSPRWPDPAPGLVPPDRIGRRWRALLSIIDDDGTYCTTAAPLGVGANLLVRRDALERIGGFPVDMGRVGASLSSGEETYVMQRIAGSGFETWYDGAIAVDHKIDAVRVTPAWVRRRAWHEGVVSLRQIVHTAPASLPMTAVKCLASLPVLALLAPLGGVRAEFPIRLSHNLGLLASLLAVMAGRARLSAPSSR